MFLCVQCTCTMKQVNKQKKKTSERKKPLTLNQQSKPEMYASTTCLFTKNQFTINAMTLPNSIFIYAKNISSVRCCCAFRGQLTRRTKPPVTATPTTTTTALRTQANVWYQPYSVVIMPNADSTQLKDDDDDDGNEDEERCMG